MIEHKYNDPLIMFQENKRIIKNLSKIFIYEDIVSIEFSYSQEKESVVEST